MHKFLTVLSISIAALAVSCSSPLQNSHSDASTANRAVYTDFAPDSNPSVRAVIKSDVPFFTSPAGNVAPVFNSDPSVNAVQFLDVPNPPVNSITTSQFSIIIDLDSTARISDYYRVYANLDIQLEPGNTFSIFVNGEMKKAYLGDGLLQSFMLNAYVKKSSTQSDNGHIYTIVTFRLTRAYRSLDANAVNKVTMRATSLRNVAKLQSYSNLPAATQHFLVYKDAASWLASHAQYGWSTGWDIGYIPLVTTATDLVQFRCYYYAGQSDFVYRPNLNDALYSPYVSDQTDGLWFFNLSTTAADPNDVGKATLSEYFSSSQYEHVYSTEASFHASYPQFDNGTAVAKVYLLSDLVW